MDRVRYTIYTDPDGGKAAGVSHSGDSSCPFPMKHCSARDWTLAEVLAAIGAKHQTHLGPKDRADIPCEHCSTMGIEDRWELSSGHNAFLCGRCGELFEKGVTKGAMENS